MFPSPAKKQRSDVTPVGTPVGTPTFGTPTFGTPVGTPVGTHNNRRNTFPPSPSSPSSPLFNRSAPAKPKRKSTENDDSEYRWFDLLFQIRNNPDMPGEMKEFIQKLDSGKTIELSREKAKDSNHIFIDKKGVTPRLVYKFIPVKQYNNEIRTYEALEAKYPRDEYPRDKRIIHYLNRVFSKLFEGSGYGVLVTEYMYGLKPGNLLLVDDGDTTSEKAKLQEVAKKYLLDAGIKHEDSEGNLYSVNGEFLWIDFEDVEFEGDKGSSSSSSSTRRKGLFGMMGGKGKSRRKIRRRKSHGRKSRRKNRAK